MLHLFVSESQNLHVFLFFFVLGILELIWVLQIEAIKNMKIILNSTKMYMVTFWQGNERFHKKCQVQKSKLACKSLFALFLNSRFLGGIGNYLGTAGCSDIESSLIILSIVIWFLSSLTCDQNRSSHTVFRCLNCAIKIDRVLTCENMFNQNQTSLVKSEYVICKSSTLA